MSRTHYQAWTLGDGREVDVEFTFTPGCDATGPTYACGGQPAEPPEVEIDTIWLKPEGGGDLVEVEVEVDDAERERIEIWLIEDYEPDDGPDPDDARDRDIDDRLTERLQ